MPHIGSRKHAAEIHDWFRKKSWNARHNDAPKGWELLGSGSFRYCYKHIETGVAYKVETRTNGGVYGSRQEARIAQSLRKNKVFNKVRIPLTSLFRFRDGVVLAMEVVVGTLASNVDDVTQHAEALRELYSIGFHDMHPYNFFIDDDGNAVPVDMASTVQPGQGDLRTISGLSEYNDEYQKRFGRSPLVW